MQGKIIPESKWNEFLEALEEHYGVIQLVCTKMNIARSSYYNKRFKDPNFAHKADLIFDRIQVPIAEEMLRANVLQNNWQAIKYTLDRASRKYHPQLSANYISDTEDEVMRIEARLLQQLKSDVSLVRVMNSSRPMLIQKGS